MTAILSHVLSDLSAYRLHVPAVVHPMRALFLARAVAGVPAAPVAQGMGISRSYLAGLENYGKPLTDDLLERFEQLLEEAKRNKEVAAVLSAYQSLLPWKEGVNLSAAINHVCEYAMRLEKALAAQEYIKILGHIIFEALSGMQDLVDIAWDKAAGGEEGFRYLTEAEGIAWPAWWPEGQIPRVILATPKSFFLGWVAGLLTTEQLVAWYVTEKTPPPVVLADRRHGPVCNLSAMVAVGIFLFDKIDVTYSLLSPPNFPVKVTAWFQGRPIEVIPREA